MTDTVPEDMTFKEAAKAGAENMVAGWMGDFVDGRLQVDVADHEEVVSKAEKLMEGILEGRILVTTQSDRQLVSGAMLFYPQANVAIPTITVSTDFARIASEEDTAKEKFIREIPSLTEYFETRIASFEDRGVSIVDTEEWKRLHEQK